MKKMSLDKAIEHKKEKRKPYYGAKAIDSSCRNHGDCDWCLRNRKHKNIKKLIGMDDRMKDYDKDVYDGDE